MGLATLVVMRCLKCLSHRRCSEDENALSNLRRYWKASVNLLTGTIQKIPSDDAWLDRDPSGEHANRQAGAADDGYEVLYGRAGFLYALLRVRKTLAEATTLKSLEVVVGSIMKRGKLGARSYARSVAIEQSGKHIPSLPPLMWSWHGRRYLGGAHGVTGILQILLSCPRTVAEKHISDVILTVEWLVASQDPEGNWPTKAGDERSQRHQGQEHINELVQRCHGAPGTVILLSTMIRLQSTEHSYFKLDDDLQAQLRTSIQRGADVIYERGLLRKGLGLCHGVAGSVYALLSASCVLDQDAANTPYFKKAIHLAHLATQVDKFVQDGAMKVPDRPWSLYEGMSGMCCAWAEVLQRLSKGSRTGSNMPGYDDLLTVE
ncbi:hypothetical protein FA15DRAFT_711068 [Coprinopsis marcescibilis]|uniref:Lanthionine synthetase C family protein n=1 Tax=Coprinopsis marcescibilis TaxID=230819 RepID=A0A5C3KBP1_COPMA|nr:hypothetical protein FA15DRAFT_711068 [Coprinopsis marcescibilis]